MEALGFDLYTQMLERTVAELRGEEVEDETSVTLNLGRRCRDSRRLHFRHGAAAADVQACFFGP